MTRMYLLVVDDNPAIHIDFKKILMPEHKEDLALEAAQAELLGTSIKKEEYDFIIDSAYQGEEALELIRKGIENNQRYALAFVDVRMPPGMDGIETAKHLWELDPEIQVVICTAYTDYSWEDLATRLGRTDRLLILKKPFENIEVLQMANALVKKWQMSQQLHDQLEHLEKLVEERTDNLAKSLAVVRATLEATTDGILVVNANKKITDFNQKALQILHLPQALVEAGDDQAAIEAIINQLKDEKEFVVNDTKAYEHLEVNLHEVFEFKDGRVIEYFSAPQYVEDKAIGRVFTFRDITASKKMEEQLLQHATHDSLTGLPNRVLLYDRVQQALSAVKRTGGVTAILFLDINNFKLINDTLGHAVGDHVLKAMAGRLQECVRGNDTLARIGGDEFVILIPFLEKVEALLPVCQKLLTAISIPFNFNNQTVTLTASIGISLYPKDGKDANTLVKNADTATHASKALGRNTFNFFTMELDISAMKRLTLENNLRGALEKGEFLLNYQPIIELATGKIIGTEALLRWQHPTLGLIPPQEFISVAEEIGLMLPIGDWILATACAQNKAWQKQGFAPLRMAVNLTSSQLAQIKIVEKIARILKQTNLDPNYLELEITESVIVECSDKIVRTVQEFKNIGVKIAIDDFGTGYSSLNYLQHLPIDKIKIDRSFINDISPNPNNVAVVLAIIAMTKSLKLRSLAEGVETKAQLEFLRQQHCDEIQGFYFYRPQSAENLAKLLEEQQK